MIAKILAPIDVLNTAGVESIHSRPRGIYAEVAESVESVETVGTTPRGVRGGDRQGGNPGDSVTKPKPGSDIDTRLGVPIVGARPILSNPMPNSDYSKPTTAAPAEDLIPFSEVNRITNVPRSTWSVWEAAGRAPKGIKMGPRKTLWTRADVLAFVAARKAA